MMKWLLVLVIGVIVLGLIAPQLHRLGLGRLPGDFAFRFRGRMIYLPITSTVLISLIFTLMMRIF